ncbi:helix-turn-helix domain-containing protein [Neorhizobium sp. BETTINA12A]|uniref:cyclic nucleotide-binding domain-containing protein n=1 Tax=unclassified Neorhizobium TaxID=2629175 RepID=UPI001FF12969|nr:MULTISPECIES: cyclic nucleotide-binding domain-containing protein [unclassified Neorhizobium]MCJ9672543.1 helix-turn-helix domain-containing protein [Neorhizobium sp. SHOUNA12B]MCJ9743574.1 helix-turn-helix domain-containing protein [Neorhizobium sp. SHOUNA12A]MCJ9753051.1 helix-turn-helix domain-containing protein [Neorhizobium sp. BETTINA12A]
MFVTDNAKTFNSAAARPLDEPDCLHSLFAKQPVEYLAAGQPLFFEGDEARHIFEVIEGNLRVFRIISEGRRVITGFLHAGDMIGVSLRDNYIYTAEAITTAKVRRLSRRQFEAAIINSESLRPKVFARVCDEMAAAQDQMVLLSSKSAEERICTFLLKYLKRAMAEGNAQPIVELSMSRQDMADYLGLTIETVSRTITRLIGKGVLNVLDPAARHSIRIERPGMLAQLAGDDDDCGDMRRDLIALGERRRH